MDWLYLVAAQGTLKSLLQHHSSKASILQHSAFFMVQLSHPYMTTGKTIPLTIQTFVDKVMSLLFNLLSRFVIAFLPRRKHLLISWLRSPTSLISAQFSSVSQSCLTLCNPMHFSTPGFPVHHQLPELIQAHVHQVSDAIQPSHPLLSPSPLAFNISQHQGLFKWVRSSHQMAKVWSFRFSISPSNEYSRLISFRMDWLDLLAVQGTFKSLF